MRAKAVLRTALQDAVAPAGSPWVRVPCGQACALGQKKDARKDLSARVRKYWGEVALLICNGLRCGRRGMRR